ncbi:MAG: LAGLIDADG family homing endonuclease, partial [Acidimicrobiales bacterium]
MAGFVDGEGSFNVPIRRERDRMMPLRAGLSFNVSQIGRSHPEMLQEVFVCGTVRERKDSVVY